MIVCVDKAENEAVEISNSTLFAVSFTVATGLRSLSRCCVPELLDDSKPTISNGVVSLSRDSVDSDLQPWSGLERQDV